MNEYIVLENTTAEKDMKLEKAGVFYVHNRAAIFNYQVAAGKNKDYYFDIKMEALRQKFKLLDWTLFSDAYENIARKDLRTRGFSDPSKNSMAETIELKFRPDIEAICKQIVKKN